MVSVLMLTTLLQVYGDAVRKVPFGDQPAICLEPSSSCTNIIAENVDIFGADCRLPAWYQAQEAARRPPGHHLLPRSRHSDTLKEGKQDIKISSARNTGRAPAWDARHHRNHCDTIACSAIVRAHPSTREARGTGGGRSSSRRTPTTPLHIAPKFLPEKGREAGPTRCGGVQVK
jgi:hypothetical protein